MTGLMEAAKSMDRASIEGYLPPAIEKAKQIIADVLSSFWRAPSLWNDGNTAVCTAHVVEASTIGITLEIPSE